MSFTSVGRALNSHWSTSTDTEFARAEVWRMAVKKPVGYEKPLIQ